MKTRNLSIALLISVASGAALAAAASAVQTPGVEAPMPSQVSQSEVRLLFVQPFVLDESYRHAWRADQPQVSAGYLVAVSADAELLPPRQVHNALLFAGEMPLERLNDGSQSGIYVGLLPSPQGADGEPTLDLRETPLFWAKPEILPESLTPDDARSAARDANAVAQSAATVDGALAEAGGTVYLSTHGMLRRYAADVIERYSPLEADLVSGLRAPMLQ